MVPKFSTFVPWTCRADRSTLDVERKGKMSKKETKEQVKVRKNYSNRFPVECRECGKKFQTASILPSCPKCKGSDIDIR